MVDVLLFIAENETWFYLLFGLAGALYARRGILRYLEARRAMFGLERDRALARMRQAGGVFSLALAASVATFVLSTFVIPSLPAGVSASPLPTVSLLSSPAAPTPTIGEGLLSATPLPEGELDSRGCANPEATFTQPVEGASMSGIVEIRGTANITNFGFYKVEYRGRREEGPWQAVLAGDQPVIDDLLGEWDTALVGSSGDFLLRLVVADTAGNAPLPCVIPIQIVP
jgi:hypothetical protein